ncbi:hypothetical protein E2562_008734 [Oryza meyeriana var. granulata]|uniref:Uncharacterized protein n=1 Tax=Oryza meyeriana var. granulata TaxID=110450 RepID=A0A6G1F5L3_9ORYZ|nr:hypothetical protein E2562_008734 [Oryza meyeriana var. granulata]
MAAAAGAGKRKRSFSEDDAYLVLHRYQPATILTLLQEVGKHVQAGKGIDWRALVRKTNTGITSPREFQMLWRHFAYGHELVDSVDPGAQPLDDESDLECEIEIVPAPGNEALAEATAFAKTIISGSLREQASGQRVNSEAAALNTQNEKIVRVPSDKQLVPSHRLTNGTGPVSSSKQPSNAGSSPDPLDPNGHPKKKKKPKPWSKEEDAELAAGVQQYVTMEDLFPEDMKQEDVEDPKIEEAIDPKDADMIEFDRFVAQGCLNKDNVDKSKTPEAQGVVGCQKKQLKMLPTVGKNSPIFAGAPATAKKNRAPVPQGGMSSGIVGKGNVGVLNISGGGKAPAPATAGTQNTVQKPQSMSSKGNLLVPKIVAPGTVTPANNRANTAVNGASKVNLPASQKPA